MTLGDFLQVFKEHKVQVMNKILWRREEDGVLNWLFLQGCYSIEPNVKQKLYEKKKIINQPILIT